MKNLLAEISFAPDPTLPRSIWLEAPIKELRELVAFHSFKALKMVKEAGLDVPEVSDADR